MAAAAGDDADDLYGDLFAPAAATATPEGARTHAEAEGAALLRLSLAQVTEKLEASIREAGSLREQLEAATAERDKLREEKEVLLRNISCVFETAREEIKRKDRTIAELRTQAEQGAAR